MIHILLMILKILGIILLAILGILLLLILLVLFVPIRYGAEGQSHENYSIKAKVSWLLHLVHGSASFADDHNLRIRLRILGIPLFKMDKSISLDNMKGSSDKKKDKEDEFDDFFGDDDTTSDAENNAVIDVFSEDSDSVKSIKTKSSSVAATPEKTEKIELSDKNVNSTKKEKPETNTKEKEEQKAVPDTESVMQKIRSAAGNISSKSQQVCDKINAVYEKANDFYEFLISEHFTGAFMRLKKELLLLLKRILPRKSKADLVYGFENPETTGRVLGILSYASSYLPGKIRLTPEFEKTIVEGNASFSGYIIPASLIPPVIRVLLDKNVRVCIKKFRNK